MLLFGVAGALVFRALAIGAGITLIERVQWITYLFATLILFAAWRLLFGAERERKVVKEACDVCEETLKGSIEPGKLADFLVLSDDVLTVPEDKILSIRPFATYVGGRQVYGETTSF